MITVAFKKLESKAVLPEYGSLEAAGGDLRSVEFVIIPSKEWRLIDLGFSMALPAGYEAQVRPRSGLARKHGITILNSPGTIDSDYRGPMGALLINHSPVDFTVNSGDRIAQMVIAPVKNQLNLTFVEVDELPGSARGAGGWGSTGRN